MWQNECFLVWGTIQYSATNCYMKLNIRFSNTEWVDSEKIRKYILYITLYICNEGFSVKVHSSCKLHRIARDCAVAPNEVVRGVYADITHVLGIVMQSLPERAVHCFINAAEKLTT